MLATYSHTRAAILCFGGWGLQTAFHLLPRLQAAQEQRAALGAMGPDLGQVTRIGVLFPEWQLDGQAGGRFGLYTPLTDSELPPFLVEHLLGELHFDDETVPLTAAELRANALREALAPYLVDLTPRPLFAGNAQRATRRDLFAAAVRDSENCARLLETHIIDPIRTDILDPDDPFVQTTLYVVAPLFEPLAGALIWPIVARLLARVGRRHIAQVVAMFATGSYATDLSRSIEDGSSYLALQELEILAGLQTVNPAAIEPWRSLVARADRALADQVGQPLFDFVYLLDREKSNQSLARDSHEVAALAGNALEAMIVAGGNLFIQEQLGIGLRTGDGRPYSLLGAAGDYVPVSQVLHAIHRQEESRLVREWVLRSSSQPPNPLVRGTTPPPFSSLAELGLEQQTALTQVVERLPDLFDQSAPAVVEDLQVRRDTVWPTTLANAPFRVAPRRWQAALTDHLNGLEERTKLAVGVQACADVWGSTPAAGDLIAGVDDRVLPHALHQMHRRLVDHIVASPMGLNNAQRQVQQWIVEAERMHRRLEPLSSPTVRRLHQIQTTAALHDWQSAYDQSVADTPLLVYALLRALAATGLVGLVAVIYLWLADRGWIWSVDGLTLLGFAVGALSAAVIFFGLRSARARQLQQERVALAQAQLTAQVRADLGDGLLAVYAAVLRRLRAWSEMLADARHELHALSSPPAHPLVSPDTHTRALYTSHSSNELVEYCSGYLRNRLDQQGRRTEDRLDLLWGQSDWRSEIHAILRAAPDGAARSNVRPARSIADYIRKTVRDSVAPASLDRHSPARPALIRELAQRFGIEQMLWRNVTERRAVEQHLQALTTGAAVTTTSQQDLRLLRRYVDAAWNRAKPAANYDVSDRLAVYAITIDFVAASGLLESDMARAVAGEFNLTLLPTQDPFSICFVRTVHGIGRDDLDSMRRYRGEFLRLTDDERALVSVVDV